MSVQACGLAKRHGRDAALAGVDLDVEDGEFLAILGPSGAGKTTLLRLIAGLDRPDEGAVLLDGQDIRRLAPRERRIGFVFQNYALFRHMTVARNVAFGLSVRPRRERPSRRAIAVRVEELLDLMQLSGLGGRFPAQLSGGQRQRAALARALAVDPKILLLDEPFGALDAKVRAELREWLRDLQRKLGVTTIFVTHDQHEAFALADRIAILNAGRIEQVGTPAKIRHRPMTVFVQEFLGAADHPGRPASKTDIGDNYTDDEPSLSDVGAIGAPATVLANPGRVGCRAPAHLPTQTDILPTGTTRAGPGPDNTAPPADPPVVAAGELWLIELADAKNGATSFERHALATANVIIYDRALTDAVAVTLPLGGYAEPAAGDGLVRSLQFVRDGWSVVRLVEPPATGNDPAGRLRRLARRLREMGASADLRLRRLAEENGRWHCRQEMPLGDADLLLADRTDGTHEAIIVGPFSGLVPDLCAVAANGLAG